MGFLLVGAAMSCLLISTADTAGPADKFDLRYWKLQLPLDANKDGKVDEKDHLKGYAGDAMCFKAGTYNQCSTKDDPAFWYPACESTSD